MKTARPTETEPTATEAAVNADSGRRGLFVGGEWIFADGSFERLDPARPTVSTGSFAAADRAHVELAYAAAAEAQPAWAATTAIERADLLRRAADLLAERAEEAARRLTADMGKAIRDARAEVQRSVSIFRYVAGTLEQPSGETYPSADPATTLLTVEQPLGLVCVITPWNFPFAIPAWKLAPAIGFGNAVVWKPAAAASGSAVVLTEVFEAAGLPAGVLNLLTGSGGSLSAALTGEPRLAALSFTGSGGVGTGLRQAVADRNVKVQLELGGKNAAIVLADADLGDAAQQIARGAMLSTGQRCTATSRAFVEAPVLDEFRRLLVEAVEAMRVGDPFDESTEIGPLASPAQRQTVREYLELAAAESASFLTGGGGGEGCYVEPTVLEGVAPGSRLLSEEIFGPVLVLTGVDGFEAAVAAANATEFGLSSALFTRDLGRALEFVRATESGVVHLNRETSGAEPHVPFGGIKASSSMSREQGIAARQFFTTTKTVYIRAT